MNKKAVIFFAIVVILGRLAFGDKIDLSDPNVREQYVQQLKSQSQTRKAAAGEFARQNNIPMRWVSKNGSIAEIMGLEDGVLTVYQTHNVNAAISIGVDKVRQSSPFNASGDGVIVGLWDGGNVLTTHQEFDGRVVIKDSGGTIESHATHVCGTIAASGITVSAKGMAPQALVDSYEWDNDTSEMASRAMSAAGEAGTLQLSNHSYGTIAGWYDDGSELYWYGTWGYREDETFGQYNSEARTWDDICYDAPYYLPFKSAGNDRNDSTPVEGENFKYFQWPKWKTKSYSSATDPYTDGWDNGGFDTISDYSTAKNIVTVGAVNDAVTSSQRDLSKATMTGYSCWGPADDGRIKPDLVTNGNTLNSSISTSNTSYTSYSGTSMASPGACGAAAILIDYYGRCFPGQYMRASTIKGLMIHTADDLGNAGPDYKFGWGLVNTEAAANVIKDQNDFQNRQIIIEDTIPSGGSRIYNFAWNGTDAIKATLCWTDPAGTAKTGLDNTAKALVNDLDLRITDSNGIAHLPFVLEPTTPNAIATTGDNIRDNVEQVYMAQPQETGLYHVVISHKGMLSGGSQSYSLLLTGQSMAPNAPDNFAVSTADICGQAILSWSYTDYADGYNIYYQENVSGPSYQPTVNGMPESGADVGDVNFVVIGDLTPGTDYHFAVVAYNAKGYSGYSADVNVVVCNQCPSSLSGYVRTVSNNGIEGVSIVAGSAGNALTDANGFYEIIVPYQWSGSVIASRLMWDFAPVEIVLYEPLTADINDVNFVGIRVPDLNIDSEINFIDFTVLGSHWQSSDCRTAGWCDDADLDLSGTVDFIDLQLLTERWLDSI